MFKKGASCALGAAYEALYGYPGDTNAADVEAGFQSKIKEALGVPNDFCLVGQIGMDRNDKGWSREEIADWLEETGGLYQA